MIRFGISDEQAWGVGLACGSTIDVLVEPELRAEVEAAARAASGVPVVTRLPADAPTGNGPPHPINVGPAAEPMTHTGDLAAVVARLAERGRSGTVTVGEDQFFIETFARPPRVVVFGAVQAAISLVRMARELGYRTAVADAREAFATRERFADADDVVVGWPDEVAAQIGLGADDAVVVMSHDPKLDEPAIVQAIRAGCHYVGAMGSRRTQAGRRERLRAAGVTDGELARLRGPIGLDLGGREPAEMALAILAEIVAARNDASAAPLSRR